MAFIVALVGVDAAIRDQLQRQLPSDVDLISFAQADDLLAEIPNQDRIDVILLGLNQSHPLLHAHRMRTCSNESRVLIFCLPEDCRELLQQLRFAPLMDKRVSIISCNERELLAERILTLCHRTDQQRAYQKSLTAAQRALDKGTEAPVKKPQYLQLLLEHLPVGIVNMDGNGRVLSMNRCSEQMLGIEQGVGVGQQALDLFPPAAHAELEPLFGHPVNGTANVGHIHLDLQEGYKRILEVSTVPVSDYVGQPVVIIMLQDVTEHHQLVENFRFQANHDPLTGLINRREFENRLGQVLEATRDRDSVHVLCYMDLDQFKVVNDEAGHQAGDELLREITGLMLGNCRSRDSLARLGGDEFALLMEYCEVDVATRIAENLRQTVEGFRFNWQGTSFRVGISIGIIAITRDSPELRELMEFVDRACYEAKRQGRNQVCSASAVLENSSGDTPARA